MFMEALYWFPVYWLPVLNSYKSLRLHPTSGAACGLPFKLGGDSSVGSFIKGVCSHLVYRSNRAQPPLEFIPPAFDARVFRGVRSLLPLWMTWQEQIVRVEARQVERLVQLYQAFQQNQIRFLLAFRHPSPADSFVLARLLWYKVPQVAQQMGVKLTSPTHAHFLYDRGIPLWAGQGVGWLYSKLGGTPIQRGKVDRQGLRSARDLFARGKMPMAAAPEGGNNGHSELVSPLEPGVAQLGFWCMEDMIKAERSEDVLIVPIGITYHYENPPWVPMEELLIALEKDAGLPNHPSPGRYPLSFTRNYVPPSIAPIDRLYPRLYALGERLLELVEAYYRNFYMGTVDKNTLDPSVPNNAPATHRSPGSGDAAVEVTADLGQSDLPDRLQRLLDAALQVAESYFQLPAKGTVIDRCRRIEQAGWERIYREELGAQHGISAVERGLADRIAEEASLRMWHMRLVENFVAVTGQYVRENPTAERFAETLLLLRDTVFLIQGKNPFPRPKLGPQSASVIVGEPLALRERWPAYTASRRQAVDQLTQNLQSSLEGLILNHPAPQVTP